MLRRKGYLLVLTLFIASCASSTPPAKAVDTTDLTQLQNAKRVTQEQNQKTSINPIRIQALKDTAMTIGAQGALAMRSQQIDQILTKDSRYLDQTFNFNSLILAHNVLPPVLEEGRHTLNLADDQTIRIADQTYTIVQQAKFVTAAPTWHDYLWMDFPKPTPPDNTLLPKNSREQRYWKKYVTEGWRQGIEQANSIFAENIARLERDYEGIALYRKLVDENMISTPYVATTPLGITGGGDQMTINDQVQRITTLPQLNPQAQNWKPAVANPDVATPNEDN